MLDRPFGYMYAPNAADLTWVPGSRRLVFIGRKKLNNIMKKEKKKKLWYFGYLCSPGYHHNHRTHWVKAKGWLASYKKDQ